ncbi:kinase-like domain-containing protein [Russula compacta]|nr:kinase-like domain-containing protein [Russula compacta]
MTRGFASSNVLSTRKTPTYVVFMLKTALHQLVSSHPNVITLRSVIQEEDYTFAVMDDWSDGNLSSQILHKRRYLGQNNLIKHVFLQLLDAIKFCHNLGIYHRDLKPDNVVCFDGGLRLAIANFGSATTETRSVPFEVGDSSYMSPECKGGHLALIGPTQRGPRTYGHLESFF